MFTITTETAMFKTIVTLVRGAAFRAEEEFADRSALLILDQQIRDAAAGIERAKRALAIAIAQDEAEGTRPGTAGLAEDEATLRRRGERQAEDAGADTAYETFDANPVGVAEKLEAAGFGKRTRPTAADVLARLKQKTGAPAPAA